MPLAAEAEAALGRLVSRVCTAMICRIFAYYTRKNSEKLRHSTLSLYQEAAFCMQI